MTGWRKNFYDFYLYGPLKLLYANHIVEKLILRRLCDKYEQRNNHNTQLVFIKGLRKQHNSGEQWQPSA